MLRWTWRPWSFNVYSCFASENAELTGAGSRKKITHIFPIFANVTQSALKITFKHQLQIRSALKQNSTKILWIHKTLRGHTICQRAYPAIWLKLLSHQIANYNKCVITVIAFKMTVPECAVTLAHLIKPISVSVMFASQLVITQSHKQRASLSAGCLHFIGHLKPCCGWRFMFSLFVWDDMLQIWIFCAILCVRYHSAFHDWKAQPF